MDYKQVNYKLQVPLVTLHKVNADTLLNPDSHKAQVVLIQ